MILSRMSPNRCTDPIHVTQQSMRINVNYNKYELNNPQKRQNIKKIFKKTLKVMILSRTSRNWCTDPIHVTQQSMRINVNYNKYELNNPQKRQKIKES
jgi:glutaredoxin-related protein